MSWDDLFWVFFGLLGATLLVLAAIELFKGVSNSTVNQAPVVTPMGFEAAGKWTVPTRYAVSFPNSARSEPTPPISSETQTNPKFAVPLTFQTAFGQAQWFRSLPPYTAWTPHIMKPLGMNVFVDVFDPALLTIPTPAAPVGNGKFDGKWNAEANEQVVPWVLPSKYRVRYLFGEIPGPWSPYTEEFVSDRYTHPSLRAQPNPLYRLEWEVNGSVIELPSVPNKVAFLNMTTDDQNSFGINIPFGAWWPPDSPTLIMSPVNFANIWNASNFWPMNVRDDGKLQIIVSHQGSSGDVRLSSNSQRGNEWWTPMGFAPAGDWQLDEPITAEQSVATRQSLTTIGTETFIDQGNPFK